jgi:hypothetical protein
MENSGVGTGNLLGAIWAKAFAIFASRALTARNRY